jgi:tRNA-uridine 2-sulfurtransferase
MAKAVALYSGGLDSILSILSVLKQGIEVNALKFITPFDCHAPDGKSSQTDYASLAEGFGFRITFLSLDEVFLNMVKNPRHGYGKNMNPCIDCRILMLREAGKFMETIGASFLFTGEVLGQRPMSQRKDMLYHIDKEAGLKDTVVRPLSAKLLRTTLPEIQGIVQREMLHGFSGRSRKPQMALAEEYGLKEYPSPAGGCLLTDPIYAHRLKDLLTNDPSPSFRDIALLKTGRHFRFSPDCKIIIGRDKDENMEIESLSAESDFLLKVEGHGSPLTLVNGQVSDEALNVAASLCARYSDGKNADEVLVSVVHRGNLSSLRIAPATNRTVDTYRIEKGKRSLEIFKTELFS